MLLLPSSPIQAVKAFEEAQSVDITSNIPFAPCFGVTFTHCARLRELRVRLWTRRFYNAKVVDLDALSAACNADLEGSMQECADELRRHVGMYTRGEVIGDVVGLEEERHSQLGGDCMSFERMSWVRFCIKPL